MGGGIELKENRWFPVISMVCNTAIIIKTPQTLLCKASKEQHKKVVNSSKLNEPSSGPLSIRLNTLIILTYNDIINTSTKNNHAQSFVYLSCPTYRRFSPTI